jgi:hypothetical protein
MPAIFREFFRERCNGEDGRFANLDGREDVEESIRYGGQTADDELGEAEDGESSS